MKPFRWNSEKDSQLQTERGINFDVVVRAIQDENVLDVIDHPNQEKYSSQRIFIIEVNQYVYLVPFLEDDQEIFLKTIIPSRKMTKKYLGE